MEPNTQPTQSGERVSQGLHGVRERARKEKQEQFTALLHHVTVDLLRESYYKLKRKAAPGVDGVRWEDQIQGKNRMRSRKYGCVRGVAGNGHPYRDGYANFCNFRTPDVMEFAIYSIAASPERPDESGRGSQEWLRHELAHDFSSRVTICRDDIRSSEATLSPTRSAACDVPRLNSLLGDAADPGEQQIHLDIRRRFLGVTPIPLVQRQCVAP